MIASFFNLSGFVLNYRFEYDYKVDVEYDTKVWLNFDITIATPCQFIGADVVDITDQVIQHNAVSICKIASVSNVLIR